MTENIGPRMKVIRGPVFLGLDLWRKDEDNEGCSKCLDRARRREAPVIGRLIGLVLLMTGLFILVRSGPTNKYAIICVAIGIIFFINKIYKKEY